MTQISAQVARFVRDTDFSDHSYSALLARFGREAVHDALRCGYIARQRWGRDVTDYIDLTASGENFLTRLAFRQFCEIR